MTNPAHRLKTARIAAGFSSAGDFAEAHGFPAVTYRSHESGLRNFKVQSAKAYAAAFGMPHPAGWRWLMLGDEQDKIAVERELVGRDVSAPGVDHVRDHHDAYLSSPGTTSFTAIDGDFVGIPVYDVSASAGAGTEPFDAAPDDHLVFSQSTLQRIAGTRTQGLAGLSVRGDSMEPTLNHGDQILVDLSINSPMNDGIYVLRLDNSLMVKRLSIDPFRRLVSVHSDNVIYAPITELSLDQVEVVGKVIWLGRRL